MKYLLQFICLLTGFLATEARASTEDPTRFKYVADSLANIGNHRLASVYYEKACYFSTDRKEKIDCLLKASNELKAISAYDEATVILEAMPLQNLSDSSVFQLKIQASMLSYLNRDFSAAESHLLQAAYLISDSSLIYNTYPLLTLVLNERFRWAEARTKILEWNSFTNRMNPALQSAINDSISRAFDPSEFPRLKNKKKAVRLSTFLPGSGQFYAGYAGEGLISFGALAGTTALMIAGIWHQYYFSSLVLGNVIIGKFYQGGLTRTEFLIDKRNYLRTRNFNEKLRTTVIGLNKK